MIVLALALRAQEPSNDQWVVFNSEPGRFSVRLPAKPTDRVQTVPGEHGPYASHLFAVKSAKSVFLLAWVDYDPSFNFAPQSELETSRDNFVEGIKATLLTSKNVTFDGYQAIEFTAETNDTLYKSRVYIVGRRPYQLVAGTAKGADDSANVARFFESFKVRLR
jgi:hypothetical protein